jgi:hypothetical protein
MVRWIEQMLKMASVGIPWHLFSLAYLPDAGLGQSAGTPFLDRSWLEVAKSDGIELFVCWWGRRNKMQRMS